MEVLTMFKFWKTNPNTIKPAITTTTNPSQSVHDSAIPDYLSDESNGDDDDDSFFELELTPPSLHSSINNQSQSCYNDVDDDDDEIKMFMKKPQSPISIIRSVPSQKLFKNVITMMLKRSNNRVEDYFSDIDSVSSPKRLDNDLIVKFNLEDGSIVPKLTRSQSRSKIERRNGDVITSKRFSKDSVQKYLNNVIKPKPKSASKKEYNNNNGGNSSPLMKEKEEKQSSSIFKVKCKKLGKSKSDSAMIGVGVSSPMRNDVLADGIEGAILHCKLSLTSTTKGNSSLSRCSSDPSH